MPNVGSILEHVPGVYVDDIPVELSGTVSTFTNNTITLGLSASSTSNYYVGHFVYVEGTAGYDPDIISYDGITKVATIKGWGQSVSTSTVNQWSAGTPAISATWKLINRYPVQKRHQWVKNGVDIPGAIGLSYTPSTAGNYQVRETSFFVDNNLVELERSVNLTAPISVTGTRDPALVYWDNLEYLGCFTTPSYNGGNNDDFSYSGPIAFNPDGNGGQGSLFIRGHLYRNLVGEISIPPQNTWATNSSAAIPSGTVLSGQTYDPLEGQLSASGITSGGGVYIGGLQVYNGKLLVTAHGDYSVGNPAAWFWQRPLNLSTVGQVQGPYSVSDRLTSDTYPRNNTRCFAGYMATVPTELQSKLGGPIIAGLSAQSIVSNTSDGPAISSFNPLDFSLNNARRGTVTVASQTSLTLDGAASNVPNFYLNWAVICTHAPNASRTSTGRITAYDATNKVATITGWGAAPLAGDTWIVIPPVPAKAMSMYGTGQLQDGTTTTYNGIPFNGYQGIFNWTARRMGGTVVPSGTRSVLVFGKAGNGPYLYTVSNRTKQGYKYFSGYGGFDTGGEKAYPYYNRCWAYDANELEQARLGNILPWNVKPYAVMNFTFPFAGSQTFSEISGVTTDPATGRIFLSTGGLPYGNTAIHVYRVNNSTVTTAPTVTIPIVQVNNAVQFQAAVAAANADGGNVIIELADGTYTLSATQYITAPDLTIRSASGNRESVIIQGDVMSTAAVVKNVFRVGSVNFTLRDVTVQRCDYHCVQIAGDSGAQAPKLINCIFRDSYEMLVKVSTASAGYVDNGLVENCLFEYTAGIGPQYYIGGIDAHKSRNWIVRGNTFKNISSPEPGLNAEHAVHFWRDGYNITVENNVIIDCDRGIGMGLGTGAANRVTGARIINNTIYHSNNPIYINADVGIGVEDSPNIDILYNTIYFENSYPRAIEYRFPGTTGGNIKFNTTNKSITSRDGGTAILANNTTGAPIPPGFVPSLVPPITVADAPVIITETLPTMPAYQSFSFPIEASGALPMTWEIVGGTLEAPMNWRAGGLPSNVVFDKYMAYVRAIGGTPSIGSFNFTIKATNAFGSAQRTLTLVTTDPSSGPPVIKTTILPNVRTTTYRAVPGQSDYSYGSAYSPFGRTRILVGGSIVGMTWTVISGSLPPGITLSTDGNLDGVATTAGSYNFTVRVTNNVGSAEQNYTINAVDAINITGNTCDGVPVIGNRKLPDSVVNGLVIAHGSMLSYGGTAPITWSIVGGTNTSGIWTGGGLPAGWSLNGSTGVFTGQIAPTVIPGEYFFTVQASNSAGTDRVMMSTRINPDPTALPEMIMQPMIATYQGPGT